MSNSPASRWTAVEPVPAGWARSVETAPADTSVSSGATPKGRAELGRLPGHSGLPSPSPRCRPRGLRAGWSGSSPTFFPRRREEDLLGSRLKDRLGAEGHGPSQGGRGEQRARELLAPRPPNSATQVEPPGGRPCEPPASFISSQPRPSPQPPGGRRGRGGGAGGPRRPGARSRHRKPAGRRPAGIPPAQPGPGPPPERLPHVTRHSDLQDDPQQKAEGGRQQPGAPLR